MWVSRKTKGGPVAAPRVIVLCWNGSGAGVEPGASPVDGADTGTDTEVEDHADLDAIDARVHSGNQDG